MGQRPERRRKSARASASRVGVALLVKRFSHDDDLGLMLTCQAQDMLRVVRPGRVLEHGQWPGDGAGAVGNRNSDPFLTMIDRQHSHCYAPFIPQRGTKSS